MSTASERIARAAEATEQIQKHVAKALGVLSNGFADGRALNSFGIYGEPPARRLQLQSAIDALNAAVMLMEVTEWPNANDYDNVPGRE